MLSRASYHLEAAAKRFRRARCGPQGRAMPNPGDFLPSGNGFAFTNAWPSEPAVTLKTPFGPINIGNAAAGLCGGMVFAALDYWHAGTVPPAARPGPNDPLYH